MVEEDKEKDIPEADANNEDTKPEEVNTGEGSDLDALATSGIEEIMADARKEAKDLQAQVAVFAAEVAARQEEEILPDWTTEVSEQKEEEVAFTFDTTPAKEEKEVEPKDELYFPEDEEDGRAWYVVHCYSGYENKVRHNLEQRMESMGMKDLIFDVVVPTEEEIEVKDGKRRSVERRVFPGYILVNMIMTEESWYVVRNTPGVTSFVGMGNDPVPLRPEEVSSIIKRMEADAPRIKVTFRSGERVRIIDGPFNDFRGTVAEIDMERAKVRVMVNFFGRETPVELDFLQVEKA